MVRLGRKKEADGSQRPVGEPLSKPWPMFKRALADYRTNWKLLVGITLIVALPVAILSNVGVGATSDSTASAYLAFVQLAMNVAVIYAIMRIVAGKPVTLRQAYYDGSAMLVRLVLVSLLIVVMLLPLVASLVIIGAGVLAPGTVLNGGEQALLILLALLIAIPSIVLITRGLWALYVIFESKQGPIQAVALSRRLTYGRVVALLGRLVALIGFLLGLLAIPIVVLVLLSNLTHWSLWAVILQTIVTLVVLPLANLYLYRYYRELV